MRKNLLIIFGVLVAGALAVNLAKNGGSRPAFPPDLRDAPNEAITQLSGDDTAVAIPQPGAPEKAGRAATGASKDGQPPAESGRHLTKDEREMLAKVFAEGVDYSKVRIFVRKWAFFQSNDTIMAPDGNIYYTDRKKSWYSDDFTTVGFYKEASFIHEMGHVYQYQQGVDVIKRRLAEGGVYKYELKPGMDLNEFTVEQQAEMLKDYAYCLRGCEARRLNCDDITQLKPGKECSFPALINFRRDPNYLRQAEKNRLEKQAGTQRPAF